MGALPISGTPISATLPEPSMRLMLSVFAACLLYCGSSTGALADKRVALVIGNSTYQAAPAIDTAVRDATAIAAMFREAGFESVDLRSDIGLAQFQAAIRDFRKTAEGSDTAIVYYAGHGLSIGRENYLIPVDADLQNIQDAGQELVSLQAVVAATGAAGKLHVVVLDACRDISSAVRIRTENRLGSHLLAWVLGRPQSTSDDTLLAYASKPGTTSVDLGGDHSPYTAALLKSLTVPGLDIRLAFGRVRDDVKKATDGRQEPYVYGSMSRGNFSLAQASSAPTTSDGDDARRDYELIARINTRLAWQVFLDIYKTGFYADKARARLKALDDDSSPGWVPPAPAEPTR
jgi:uncharacterized caspase-like protein